MEEITRFENKETWLEARKQGIGASDAAVILGISRWKSPLMLYAEKIGLATKNEESEAMLWGLRLEPILARVYEEEMGRKVERHQLTIVQSPEFKFMQASLDAIVDTPTLRGPLELKTTSAYKKQDWANEPPLEFQIQIQHQLAVTGFDWASIAVLIGGQEFFWSDVVRNKDFIKLLIEREREFWRRVELKDPPPADATEHTKEALKVMYPTVSEETVTLSPDAYHFHTMRENAKSVKKAAEEKILEADNHLKYLIGGAAYGMLPDGTTYSYKEKKGYHVDAYDVDARRELRLKTQKSKR